MERLIQYFKLWSNLSKYLSKKGYYTTSSSGKEFQKLKKLKNYIAFSGNHCQWPPPSIMASIIRLLSSKYFNLTVDILPFYWSLIIHLFAPNFYNCYNEKQIIIINCVILSSLITRKRQFIYLTLYRRPLQYNQALWFFSLMSFHLKNQDLSLV